MPNAPAIAIAPSPTASAVGAPYSTRVSTSYPSRSVPSQCDRAGALLAPKPIIADWSFGAYGATNQHVSAVSTTIPTRITPAIPIGLRRSRASPRRHCPCRRGAASPIGPASISSA